MENTEKKVCGCEVGSCGCMHGMMGGHGCHGNHGHRHLLKMILKLIIVMLIFSFGFKLGDITGSIRGMHGSRGGMMNRGGGYGMMQNYKYSFDLPDVGGNKVQAPVNGANQ